MVSVPFPNSRSNNDNNENSGLVPPQNIQAEEVVLGGILLDPDAIGRIADLIKPEAFYINACLLYTSPSPRDRQKSRMPSSA